MIEPTKEQVMPTADQVRAMKIVLAHLEAYFVALSVECHRINSPYAGAYDNAVKACRTALTGGNGWNMSLREALGWPSFCDQLVMGALNLPGGDGAEKNPEQENPNV